MYVRGYLQGSENGRVVTIDYAKADILSVIREITHEKKRIFRIKSEICKKVLSDFLSG